MHAADGLIITKRGECSLLADHKTSNGMVDVTKRDGCLLVRRVRWSPTFKGRGVDKGVNNSHARYVIQRTC